MFGRRRYGGAGTGRRWGCSRWREQPEWRYDWRLHAKRWYNELDYLKELKRDLETRLEYVERKIEELERR